MLNRWPRISVSASRVSASWHYKNDYKHLLIWTGGDSEALQLQGLWKGKTVSQESFFWAELVNIISWGLSTAPMQGENTPDSA